MKFQRQYPVGCFVLDFYCSACRLLVEADGDIHQSQQERDAERTQVLQSYGYTVLRFSNNEVFQQLEAVLPKTEVTAATVLRDLSRS